MNITSSIVSSEALIDGVAVTLRESARARRLRLTVDSRTGAVLLVLPRRASRRRALAWATEQSAWIAARRAAVPPPLPIVPEAELPYRGVPRRLDWSSCRPRRIWIDGDRIVAGGPAEGLATRMLRWLRNEALCLLTDETRHYAAIAGAEVSKVGVGDPRSRWGSCSCAGAIRYSWRLILAPDHVRRATVAHEVAHLIHLHHGPDFHALVANLFEGDPLAARAWLRRHGAALHAVGRP
ncbi:MAG: M48 family metallopeptidase [Sphingomonas sp.]